MGRYVNILVGHLNFSVTQWRKLFGTRLYSPMQPHQSFGLEPTQENHNSSVGGPSKQTPKFPPSSPATTTTMNFRSSAPQIGLPPGMAPFQPDFGFTGHHKPFPYPNPAFMAPVTAPSNYYIPQHPPPSNGVVQPSLLDDEPLSIKQGPSFVCTKLSIGNWVVTGSAKMSQDTSSGLSIEMKWITTRKRMVYQLFQPETNKLLILEFDFAQICGLQFQDNPCMMIVELTDPPMFAAKDEQGKLTRVIDFTQGNATYFRRHYVELISSAFVSQIDILLASDARLKKLAETTLIGNQATFVGKPSANICDWDKETPATIQCGECGSKYCEECDEVLHKHPSKKQHSRVQITEVSSSADKAKKRKKRKKGDKCRCGTGATKGTLGEPCTGNRCPCFSERRNCVSCGCKNCSNPFNQKQGSNSPPDSPNDLKG